MGSISPDVENNVSRVPEEPVSLEETEDSCSTESKGAVESGWIP